MLVIKIHLVLVLFFGMQNQFYSKSLAGNLQFQASQTKTCSPFNSLMVGLAPFEYATNRIMLGFFYCDQI